MIHPCTVLRPANKAVGLGVFATRHIPAGTLLYVVDQMDRVIPADDPIVHHPDYKAYIDKYSYLDKEGMLVLSWDHAKYVNHCCNSNSMTTAYGFSIAIKDIRPGEEITDEYGLLYIEEEMLLYCNNTNCRKVLRPTDINKLYRQWDATIKAALAMIVLVDQPLIKYMRRDTHAALMQYLDTGKGYRSVRVPIVRKLENKAGRNKGAVKIAGKYTLGGNNNLAPASAP